MAQHGWIEKASADNATATATKAAVAGKSHVVYSAHASFSATASKLLQIKDGTTVKWESYVYDGDTFTFPGGIGITEGAACSAVFAASGTGGIVGKVNLHGKTV